MAVRRESVVLEVTDHLTPALIKAAGASALLKRELNGLNGAGLNSRGLKSVERDAADVERQVGKTSSAFDKGEKSIDKYSGRLGLLAEAAITIGPALLPIGAVTVPAIAALTAGLGAAAGAFGVTLLAAHGLGDALKAVDAYKLAPTAENLAKVRTELDKMGPAGTQFVMYLDQLEPKLQAVQNVARAGLFPGVETGINSLLTRLPEVQRIVSSLAGTLGNLSAEAGSNLAGGKFDKFFTYLENQAGPILHDFAQAAGNVGEGLANLLVGFDPLTRGFTDGLLGMTRAFAEWSRGLDQNQGFQDFLTYLQQSGPKVMDFIESLISSLTAIATAAAPVGNVVLPLLTDLVNIVGSIANSDIGTPIFAGLAALSAYNRVLAVTKGLQTSTFGGGFSAGKAMLPIAGLALASSGLTKNLGLANTATLALIGSYAGPWGAALGAAAGFASDLSSATSGLGDAIDAAQGVSNGDDLASIAAKRAALTKQFSDLTHDESGPGGLLGKSRRMWSELSGDVDNTTAAARHLDLVMTSSEGSAAGLAKALSGQKIPLDNSATSFQRLQDALTAARPAMDALGISSKQLAGAFRLQSVARGASDPSALVVALAQALPGAAHGYSDLVHQIKAQVRLMDSQQGRTMAVADAVADLGNQEKTAATRAQDLSDALDNLLNPQENLSAATDAWTTALRHLNDDLAKHNKTLTGNTDAAIQNRAAVRDRVDSLKGMLVAQAAAGASGARLTTILGRQRQSLLDAGHAAGISKKDMNEYLNTLGLTPKLVTTLIKANTAQAVTAVQALKNLMDGLHDRDIHVNVTRSTNASVAEAAANSGPTKKASGGLITGPGGPTDDRIPALLSNREYVVKAAAVHKYGTGFFDSVNAMRFANGGLVGRGKSDPLFDGEGPRYYKAAYKHGKPFAIDGPSHWDWPYQTGFSSKREAAAFNRWVEKNNVPFDADAKVVDYDMRGYWKQTHGRGWHQGSHFPDTYKTPYDTTFSHESKYATKNNPFYWHGDRLVDTRNGQLIFAADGGYISGPGGPREDKVPAWLSSGEYVVNAQATAQNRGALDAMNKGANPWGSMIHAADDAARGLKGLKGRLDDANKALDKQQQVVQRIQSARNSLASSVTSGLRSDLFATSAPSNIYGAGASIGGDPLAVLASDIKGARKFDRLEDRLRHRGLTGGALQAAEEGGTGALTTLAGYSKAQLRQFERQYALRQRLTGNVGRSGADDVYGQKLDAQIDELRELRDEVRGLRRQEKAAEARAHKSRQEAADRMKNHTDNSATKGRQKRPGGQ